jgi:hypothetical protein
VDGLSDKIYWHPGFYGAAELELRENREELEFEQEHNLSKEPIRMDMLIVKKRADVNIKNEIGRIFKKYNVLEYKSPDDEMSIDDYYKTIGYACLYKGLGKTVNAVPAEELTVSMFREVFPEALFAELTSRGAEITERYPGIYYVNGVTLFDTQIVVTGQLSRETHSSLRILSKSADEEDVRRFLTETSTLTTSGDKHNMDAVLQVSISANKLIYEKVKEDLPMCEALEQLMQKEINEKVEKGIEQGIEQGIEKGIEQGKLDTLSSLVRDNLISIAEAAKRAGMTEALFAENMEKMKA